jgi:hypothetical protein
MVTPFIPDALAHVDRLRNDMAALVSVDVIVHDDASRYPLAVAPCTPDALADVDRPRNT